MLDRSTLPTTIEICRGLCCASSLSRSARHSQCQNGLIICWRITGGLSQIGEYILGMRVCVRCSCVYSGVYVCMRFRVSIVSGVSGVSETGPGDGLCCRVGMTSCIACVRRTSTYHSNVVRTHDKSRVDPYTARAIFQFSFIVITSSDIDSFSCFVRSLLHFTQKSYIS